MRHATRSIGEATTILVPPTSPDAATRVRKEAAKKAIGCRTRTLRTTALLLALITPAAWAANNCDGNSHDGIQPLGPDAVVCGLFNQATGTQAIAVGTGVSAEGDYSTAIGNQAWVVGNRSIAIGTAVGPSGSTSIEGANGAIAIGNNTKILGNAHDSVAVGTMATVNGNVAGAVALGAGAVADQSNTVSVGKAGSEKRIVNVAAGAAATDAVNKSQMDSAITG